MKTCVVVPTNRPERIKVFVAAWEPQFHNGQVRLIVVEDAPTWTIDLLPEWVEHRCWLDIDRELGDRASCIPTRSGGIRDFGFYLAGQDESIDMIVSLDDDVLPLLGVDFLREHWIQLQTDRNLRWHQPVPGFRLRGEPYGPASSPSMLNMGLWQGYPDVDAIAQLKNPDCDKEFKIVIGRINTPGLVYPGVYFPCCGMNVAFRREVAPYYYFPKLPEGFKRWDDIWAGIIFKRIADCLGWAVTCGWPLLKHERASDPMNNLRQEFLGYGANEHLWEIVDQVKRVCGPAETHHNIIQAIWDSFPQLRESAEQMNVWASLWAKPNLDKSPESLYLHNGGIVTASELPARSLRFACT